MSNTMGKILTVTLFGESHGPCVGAVVDGLPAGIAVNTAAIAEALSRRRPKDSTATARREQDAFTLESGVYNGYTTGTSLCIRVPNDDAHSGDYRDLEGKARPGHCDYPAYCRYEGYEDPRGGGHFSGRLTAALVAAGAVVREALAAKGVHIATRVKRCGGVEDGPWGDLTADMKRLSKMDFPALTAEAQMREAILQAAAEGDSVGGVLETVVTGLPAGVGEPWFDSVESVLSHSLFSVPAVKGVEFGEGFGIADFRGSESNDAYCITEGKITTETNRQGGIGGGITNGMPLIMRCAVKPTPSIGKPQSTVDFLNGKNTIIEIKGRHDPCIVPRAAAVADAMVALSLGDLLLQRFGPGGLQ